MKTTLITIGIVILVMLPFLTYWYWIQILNHFAEAGKILTNVASGSVKFSKKGETFLCLLFNKGEIAYDKKNDILVQKNGPKAKDNDPEYQETHKENVAEMSWLDKWLEYRYGIYYVSIFYPTIETHVWMHSWEKLGSNVEQHELFKVEHRKEPVDSLRVKYTYPVEIFEVEIKGNITINVKLRFILKVRKPKYLTFDLRGDWVPTAISELSSLFTEYARDKEYESFQLLGSETNKSSDSSKKLELSDFRKAFDGKLIVEESLVISEAVFVNFQLPERFGNLQKALTAVTENTRLGDAEIVKEKKGLEVATLKAQQSAVSITKRAEATAQGLKSVLSAVSVYHRGEEVLLADIQRETIQVAAKEGANVTLWNGMGNAPTPMMNVDRNAGKIILPEPTNKKETEK